MRCKTFFIIAFVALCVGSLGSASAQHIALRTRELDPHGSPRPASQATNVPLRTSFYFELQIVPGPEAKSDTLQADSVEVRLKSASGEDVALLMMGQRFAAGCSGKFMPQPGDQNAPGLAVYIDTDRLLQPNTTYTMHLSARCSHGQGLPDDKASWSFTTESAPSAHAIDFTLDLNAPSLEWKGAFFSGLCNVCFSTQDKAFGPTYRMMDEARKAHPRAWSYQRDFWMTGTEYQPVPLLPPLLPNIVRESETRRITKIESTGDQSLLHTEDVFGNEQYGIPTGRPVSEDYHTGDEVLIADGVHDARAKVIAADDAARTVLVSTFATPSDGWKIDYAGPLPTKEDPDAPGLFPPGGCYLRKFRPCGTPCYYWGRLDKEWDLAVCQHHRRVLVNFADATGDLAIDGRSWTTAKDLTEWHEVARTITSHLIERYGGETALTFDWSIFNEPDLGPLFWRTDWDELQRFYDYTVDAILRSFQDHSLDSNRVFVGGLELGGIFGVHLRLTEFLAHCSPSAQATAKGALPLNAAVADHRLDGKRSRRVEALCRDHGGKGSPCDFISIHAYSRSELMAAKLIRAKEQALEIDPEFYKNLWVNSHESCPDWSPPPDLAASDAYLGNGYFSTWCMDVVSRQLHQAAHDPRYGFGETILTVWAPLEGFNGLNAISRNVPVDDDGDGKVDRHVTLPNQVFHALNLLSDMGPRYWALPEQKIGGHTVSGFASRDDKRGAIRALIYSHHTQDTQSRSDTSFDVTLDFVGLDELGENVLVTEYRFDREHNSYYDFGRSLRDRTASAPAGLPPGALDAALKGLKADDAEAQRRAVKVLHDLGPAARSAAGEVFRAIANIHDEDIRAEAIEALQHIVAAPCYSRAEAEKIEKLSECRPVSTEGVTYTVHEGHLKVPTHLAGNGANFLFITKRADH